MMRGSLSRSQTVHQPNLNAREDELVALTPGFVLMVLFTGMGAGLTSGLLMKLLRLVQHLSFSYWSGDFLQGVRHTSSGHRLTVVTLAGVLGGLCLYLFKRAAGSAQTQVTGAIWQRHGIFDAPATVVKSLISIVLVGMGAAIGREAALKDTGGAIAGRLSDWASLSLNQRRLLVACGAGAGMAAAYNVPLGGALFTLEVLLGTFSVTSVLAAVTSSFLAVAVSWFMLPNVPTFTVAPLSVSPSILLWAALAGPILGMASAGYVRFIGWSETGKPRGYMIVVAPVCAFILLGSVSTIFPEVLGNGKNVVQEAFASQLSFRMLCWLLLLRPLATALCLKAGAPGGLFTPTLTFGALVGGLLGQGFSYLVPGTPKDTYAIVGGGGDARLRVSRPHFICSIHAGTDKPHRCAYRTAADCNRGCDHDGASPGKQFHLLNPRVRYTPTL